MALVNNILLYLVSERQVQALTGLAYADVMSVFSHRSPRVTKSEEVAKYTLGLYCAGWLTEKGQHEKRGFLSITSYI